MNSEQQQELLIRLFGHAAHAYADLRDILFTIEKVTGLEIEQNDLADLMAEIHFAGGAATGFITIETIEQILARSRQRMNRRFRTK